MKQYKGKDEKVTIGREHRAFFPDGHSRVKGIICEYIDLNYDGGWSNVRNYARFFYVMWNDCDKWEQIFGTDQNYTWIKCGMGLFDILSGMETIKVQKHNEVERLENEILLHKEDIQRIKDQINKTKKEIKTLK